MLPHSTAIQHVLATATNALQSGNFSAADAALAPFFNGRLPPSPDLSNIAGTLRMNQGRLGEAAALFDQASKAVPREPIFAFNLGLTLSRLGRNEESDRALRAALQYQPDLVPALFELGAKPVEQSVFAAVIEEIVEERKALTLVRLGFDGLELEFSGGLWLIEPIEGVR